MATLTTRMTHSDKDPNLTHEIDRARAALDVAILSAEKADTLRALFSHEDVAE